MKRALSCWQCMASAVMSEPFKVHASKQGLDGRDFVEMERLCELNVIEQVRSLCDSSLIRNAWTRGQELTVHGVIYGLDDGILHDLGVSFGGGQNSGQICDAGAAARFMQPEM